MRRTRRTGRPPSSRARTIRPSTRSRAATPHLLTGLGALVGVLVALASAGQLAVGGVSWLVEVALVKLAIVAAVALLAGGAFTVRLARRREVARLAGIEARERA
jgi:hypothetical protein